MFRPGAVILDRPTRAVATIRHVERVPGCCDLFGFPISPHRRYILAFEDGRYAVRGEDEIDDAGAPVVT